MFYLKYIFTLILSFTFHIIFSQHNFELYNNGALLHLASGSDMYVIGDIHMTGSATTRLENFGFIEVEGNVYGNTLFQQRGTGTFRLFNRLVNIGQAQTIYGANSYAVRGGQASIGVDDGSFYNLELANDIGTVYLSGGGNVCDVRNAVNFQPTGTPTLNRIITAEPPPTALPTNGSLYPSIFGIMNTSTTLTTVMPNNTITSNGNMSNIDAGYVQGKLRRAINAAGGNYHFVVGLEPAGTTAQRGVQLIRADFAANNYDVVSTYFETGSDNTIPGTPIECSGYTIDYFGGVDHGEWVFNQSGGNGGVYSMNVWPQDHNFPSKIIWIITKDNAISGTVDQCGPSPIALVRGGFNGFSEFGVAGADIVLPIELLNFNVYPVNNDFIQLQWITASEKNTAHFGIERSLDGINFIGIDTENASGNSNIQQTYSYNDFNVQENTLYYYRLKSVDLDGTFSYSDIRTAQINSRNNEPSIVIYPNPIINNQFQIDLYNYTGDVMIKLYDILGKLIVQNKIQTEKTKTSYNMPPINLSKGIYLLSIENNLQTKTYKIINK